MNLYVLLLIVPISAYKVLVYNPRFAYAHTKFMGAVSDALVDAGLDVTVLLNDHDDRHNLNGTTKAKIVFVPACKEAAEGIRRQTDNEFCKAIWGVSATNPLVIPGLKTVMEEVTVPQCRSQEDILERLRNEKFDVGVTEAFTSCGVGLFEAVGIKSTVVGSSMSIFESISTAIGAPLFPSFTPGTYAQGTDYMSFWGRLENLVHIGTSWDMMRYVERKEHETFVEKYGKNFPTMDELYKRAQLVFTNSIPYFDFPRLTYHKILDIGGITYEKPRSLDKKWQSQLSKGPAVLLSFGSVAKSIHMPEDYKLSVIETIKRFPNITFIWKHEEPIDPRLLQVENIFASNWIPQNDLLGHPNVTGFITHGGANSVSEAAFLGKPMIVVPVFADQTRMGNLAQERGIGMLLNKEQLGEKDAFYNAIHRLLYSEEIKSSCQRFLKLRAAVKYNPGKILADHVKLLAEFKTLKELQPKAAELNTFVLYGLDVALFLSVVIIALLVMASLVLRRLFSFSLDLLFSKKKVD